MQKDKKKRSVKKPMTAEQRESFYKKLKDSVVTKKVEADESLPDTPEKLAEQLREFHAAIHSGKRHETYMKCLMGRNLSKIQNETGKKGSDFITYVKQHLTDYCQSEIYFMMKLYDVCLLYPRLSQVTIGTGILKSKLGIITKLMEKDTIYWQSVE